MPNSSSVLWNPRLRLIFSDVDDTVAALYRPATPEIVARLAQLLDRGIRIAFITGQSAVNVEQRVVMRIPAPLRQRVAVGGCSGAELWGYSASGARNAVPFDTAEALLSTAQQAAWRDMIRQLIDEFQLIPHPAAPVEEFTALHGSDPWHVILEDRGPQITLEFPNAFRLSDAERKQLGARIGNELTHADLRDPILARAEELLKVSGLPLLPRLAGEFALDFAIEGMTKARVVEKILSAPVRAALGLGHDLLASDEMEVWGDRFSETAGTDWLMSKPLDRRVRAISFRDEDAAEFPNGYNIQLWDGTRRLHEGLLEFLDARPERAA